MSWLWQDLRFGFRMMRKHPGVSAIAVITLALGLGLTTTVFSIIDGIILKGLPLPDVNRLMVILRVDPKRGSEDLRSSLLDVSDWRSRQHAFEEIAATWSGPGLLTGGVGTPELIAAYQTTPNLFHVLRQSAALGRTLRDEDAAPDSPPVIVLSDGLWRRRYGSDPKILGTTIRLNGHGTTVVGVMPPSFTFPGGNAWVALQLDPHQVVRGDKEFLEVIGRLRPGVTVDDAAAEYAAIARHLADEYPATSANITLRVEPLNHYVVSANNRREAATMMVAVFSVLLIACVNVANLLLARAATRTREVAIRTALGADRWRVVRQLLIETLVLAMLGAVLGLGIALAGVTIFTRVTAALAPPWGHIDINPTVILFAAAIAALAALIAGLAPAIQVSRTDVNAALKDQARGSSSLRLGRLSRALVIVEIGLSCGLLIAAGVVTKSLVQLARFDYGFATDDVFTGRIPLGVEDVSTGVFVTSYPDSARRQTFWAEVLRRVRSEPGVLGACLMNVLPGTGTVLSAIAIDGATYATDRDYPVSRFAVITPGFFRTFNVTVLQGRDFQEADDWGNAPVAIVNQSFAKRFGPPHGSALGMRLREGPRAPWRTVVGVVPDMSMAGNSSETPWGYYVPLTQRDRRFMSVGARVQGDPMAFSARFQADVAAVNADLPIYFTRPLRQVIDERNLDSRVVGTLFLVFGLVSLTLSSIGLYGVMSFAVSRRTPEIGVRMALGATGTDVRGLILRQGTTQLGVGLTCGLLLALWLVDAVRFALVRVNPRDPTVFVGVAVLLVSVGLVACVIPARRASRVDPLVALRHE